MSLRCLRYHIILGVSIMIAPFSLAQTSVDSLRAILDSGPDDSTRVECFYHLFQELAYTDSAAAFGFLNEGRDIAIENKWWDMLHHLGGGAIMYSYRMGEFDECERIINAELAIYKEYGVEGGIGDCYTGLGNVQYAKGNYHKALEYYQTALTIFRKVEDQHGISVMLNNIGGLYYAMKEYEQALEYFEESEVVKSFEGDSVGLIANYQNMALIHDSWNNLDLALEYSLKSLELCEQIGTENYYAYSELLCNTAMVYLNRKEGEEAIPYLTEALDLAELEQDSNVIGLVNLYYGDLHVQRGDVRSARTYYQEAARIFTQIGVIRRAADAYQSLAFTLAELGEYRLAFEAQLKYGVFQDSLLSVEKQEAITDMEIRYQTEMKDLEIQNLEIDNELTASLLEQEEIAKENERNQKWISLGGLGFALILALIAVWGFITKRRDNRVIRLQKAEVEEKNREILDSINYAKRIQEAILPPTKLVKEYLEESFILYKPKDIVAGDFYWLDTLQGRVDRQSNGLILFAAADCTGHGVPGAMVSVVCSNALNYTVRELGLTDPGEILNHARELVIERFERSEKDVKDGMDVALCSLCAHENGSTVQFAGANNPLWIIRKGSEQVEEVKGHKEPIGKSPDPTPFTTHSIELQSGDTFYIFTDGFADQFGGTRGKKFKARPFKDLLVSIQHQDMVTQRELIDSAFETWRGDLEQVDDVCVIGVRV